MGYSTYSTSRRLAAASSAGYYDKKVDEIFTQNQKRQIHESMEPSKALLREARDSETHPHSVPIVLALDLTGSMHRIPHYLVKDGMPNMMAKIIQKGVPDPQILFLGIGDTTCDRYPLQVGQFESGDAELDLWLTRTYLEGGGGANEGESYLLTWYYAAFHTVTDAWEKRKEKGFIFTIGDEPCLRYLTQSELTELMGSSQSTYTAQDLLEKAKEKYNVYHLHIMEGSAGSRSLSYWQNLLGQNCVVVNNHQDVPNIIADIVTQHASQESVHLIVDDKKIEDKKEEKPGKIML